MGVATGNYSQQGLRITVNSFIKDPLLVRARLLDISKGQFLMEDLLRNAGTNDSGVVRFEESTPLFADEDPSLVAEGAEIPLVTGQDGRPRAAYTQKYGAGIEITEETRRRSRVDKVVQRITQVRNTFVRMQETRLRNALDTVITAAGGAQTVAVSAAVADDTGIRHNIRAATQIVREAVADNTTQQAPSYFGFEPDVIVMSTRTAEAMIDNPAMVSIYQQSPLAEKSPAYTGYLERTLLGLNVATSRFMPDAVAYIMQRKVVGAWSDERALGVTPLYEDKPREVWRADAVRQTAVFIDQPKAVAKITWTALDS